jgi:cation transport regulator
MPYNSNSDLPESVKVVLPEHAQDIYREAYNSAWGQYDTPEERRGGNSREETAHKVAWAAVKKIYERNEYSGKWRRKKSLKISQ